MNSRGGFKSLHSGRCGKSNLSEGAQPFAYPIGLRRQFPGADQVEAERQPSRYELRSCAGELLETITSILVAAARAGSPRQPRLQRTLSKTYRINGGDHPSWDPNCIQNLQDVLDRSCLASLAGAASFPPEPKLISRNPLGDAQTPRHRPFVMMPPIH